MADEQTLNIAKIMNRFQDEGEAYKFIESIRWPNGPVCPHCGSINHAYYLTPKNGARKTRTGSTSARRVWKCADCRKQFSVLVGTIFADSKVPLSKWLLAFYMMCSDKNGTASYELHRTLGIDRKTAWFLTMRIRFAMNQEPLRSKLEGIVEIDETYFGGEPKNMHVADRKRRGLGRQGVSNKIAIVSLIQRGGTVRSEVAKQVSAATLRQVLQREVESSAAIMTDGSPVYHGVKNDFAAHEAVNHRAGEYVRGTAHVNSAEGYFSQLKRSIDGTHHHVSERHLQRYLGEFDFRYNTRKMQDGERTKLAIEQSGGKRLTYREPVRPADAEPGAP